MNDYYFKDNLVFRIDDPNINYMDLGPAQTGGYEDDTTYLIVFSNPQNMDRLEKELNELLHTYINDDKLQVFLVIGRGLDAVFSYTSSQGMRSESNLFMTVNGHWKDSKMTKEQLKAWTQKELAHIEAVRYKDSAFTGIYTYYKVVTNNEEDQFKLMRNFRTPPNGWKECGGTFKDECINYIDQPDKFSVYVNEQAFDNYDIGRTKKENFMIALNPYLLLNDRDDIDRHDGWRNLFSGTKEKCLFFIKKEMMTREEINEMTLAIVQGKLTKIIAKIRNVPEYKIYAEDSLFFDSKEFTKLIEAIKTEFWFYEPEDAELIRNLTISEANDFFLNKL